MNYFKNTRDKYSPELTMEQEEAVSEMIILWQENADDYDDCAELNCTLIAEDVATNLKKEEWLVEGHWIWDMAADFAESLIESEDL